MKQPLIHTTTHGWLRASHSLGVCALRQRKPMGVIVVFGVDCVSAPPAEWELLSD